MNLALWFLFLFSKELIEASRFPKFKRVNSASNFEVSSITEASSTVTSPLPSIHNNEQNEHSVNGGDSINTLNQQPTRSRIGEALAMLPQIFGPSVRLSTRSKFTSVESVKEGSRRVAKNRNHRASASGLIDLLSPLNAAVINSENQLNMAVIQLLQFMQKCSSSEDDALPLSPGRRSRRDSTYSMPQVSIDDKDILDILALFPTSNLSKEAILTALDKIHTEIQSLLHRVIFEHVSDWAIGMFEKHFPADFWIFLDHIIHNDIQYATYQKAIKKVSLLNPGQVEHIFTRLLFHLLTEKKDREEYEFYGKFNIHFIELAMNYPSFSHLNLQIPQNALSTPTLQLILKSVHVIDILSLPIFTSDQVSAVIQDFVSTCSRLRLSASMMVEQIQIILALSKDRFEALVEEAKIIFLNHVAESIGSLPEVRATFPEIPGKEIYGLLVKEDFDDLLLLLLRHLHPIFSVHEFGYLLNLADKLNSKTPLGTLLTLLGSITIPWAAWGQSDVISERSLRLHMYIEVITSIQKQHLEFKIDPDTNPLCTSLRQMRNTKSIVWSLPAFITSKNYEFLNTADMLVIPLLFIQRVFHRDYRKSSVIDSYLRSGKPTYRQFPIIINQLLNDQCYRLTYQYPFVDVHVSFPFSRLKFY